MKLAIRLEHVQKQYGTTKALNDISFDVQEGEIFGIVGPNGAGKTTLIEIVEGLRRADGGNVTVLGMNIRMQTNEIKERIGVLLQLTSIHEKAKVKEIIQLFSSFYQKSIDVQQLNQFLGLDHWQNARIKTLSGGWKQRVGLALALINDPQILFLDEPSMGLDPNARREMWDVIKRLRNEGRTIVVTTHYMEEAENLCDRVAIIDKGKLIALDTPEKLITTLGGNKQASFKQVEQASRERIAAIPFVTDVEWGAEWIQLHSSDLDQTLKHLFRLADEDGWVVSQLKLAESSMDDVFNELTLHNGGDGE